jgi:hypothetical protein
MANRLFLTLLALLTGLAAQLAPAQARVCAEQAASVSLASPAATRSPAAHRALARLPGSGWRHATLVATNDGLISTAEWHAPTVWIGIDRALQ